MYIQPSHNQQFLNAVLSQNPIMQQSPLQQRYLSPNFQEPNIYRNSQPFACNSNMLGGTQTNLSQGAFALEGLIGGFINMTHKIINSVEEFLFGNSSTNMNSMYSQANEASFMNSQQFEGLGFYNEPFIAPENNNFLDSMGQNILSSQSLFDSPLSFLTPFLGSNSLLGGAVDFGASFVKSLTDIGSKTLGVFKNLF